MTGRRRLALIWLPLVAVAALGGWALVPSSAAAAGPTPAAPPGAGGTPASVLYAEDCASCHGSDGRGTDRGPDLAGVGEADVDFQLTTGRMPKKDATGRPSPYKAILPAADIRSLDQYVTALVAKGGPAIPAVDAQHGAVSKGKELFIENCAACHGFEGAGGILFDRPIPQVFEATPTQVAEAIRVGPAQMPVFGPHQLPADEVNDIAAYVQSMKHPYDKGGDGLSHLGPVAEGAVTWLIVMVALIFTTRWIGKRG